MHMLVTNPPLDLSSRRTGLWSGLRREPLFHFLLGGGAIFLVYFVCFRPSLEPIVVTPEMAEFIVRDQSEQVGRPLSDTERSAAIEEFIDQEVLIREAYRQGLDHSDVAIRERLADKMRFVLTGEPPVPTRRQLEEYLEAHRSDFAQSAQVPFDDLVPTLRSQWVATQRQETLRRNLDVLRKRYGVPALTKAPRG